MDMDKVLEEAMQGSEQINSILIPLHGSLSAERALHAAEGIAHARGSTLVLLRTVPPLAWAEHLGPGAMSPQEYEQCFDTEERTAHDYLDALARPLRQRGLDVRTRVECGDPQTHLLSAIQQIHPLLVVLAATDQAMPDGLLDGIAHEPDAVDVIATKVVSMDGVPVLVVPSPEHHMQAGAGVSAWQAAM